MQYYVKRAIQGRVRQSADSIGEQYSPGHMDSWIRTTQTGKTTVEAKQVEATDDSGKRVFGVTTTTKIEGREGHEEEGETTKREGYENVEKFEKDLFD